MISCVSAASVANETSVETSEQPSMAFLEFLADLKEVDGEWVSAMDIDEPGEDSALAIDTTESKTNLTGKHKPVEQQKEDEQ